MVLPLGADEQILAGSVGRYRLTTLLGGGQTSMVYRAEVVEANQADRIGLPVAVKLMASGLDRVTQRRFLQEADTLIELRTALKSLHLPDMTAASGEDDWALPRIFDRMQDNTHTFIVMSEAPGFPLDQLLLESGGGVPELDTLILFYQVLAPFVALHEALERSYLDFQPRNIFWEAESRRAMVIDWNLLSERAKADYPGDVARLVRLLYRALTGVDLPGYSRIAVAAAEAWSDLSTGTQQLVMHVLAAAGTGELSARGLRDRLAEHLVRWNQNGDTLLHDAARTVAQIAQVTAGEEKHQVWTEGRALLDLAARRGISSYMQSMWDGLHNKLIRIDGEFNALSLGQTFLRAGDVPSALAQFNRAISEAWTVPGQLLAWRWYGLAHHAQQTGQAEDDLWPQLMATDFFRAPSAAWQLDDWLAVQVQLDAFSWKGLAEAKREVRAYAVLQKSLTDRARLEYCFDPRELADWATEIDKAIRSLDELPGAVAGTAYAEAAWAYLGDSDASVRERFIEMAGELRTRQQAVLGLSAKLTADVSSVEFRAILDEHRGDPYLLGYVRGRIPEWLDDPDWDATTAEVLQTLLETRSAVDDRHALLAQSRLLDRLRTAKHVVDRVLELSSQLVLLEGASRPASLQPASVATVPLATTTGATTVPGEGNPGEGGAVEAASQAYWLPDELRLATLTAIALLEDLATSEKTPNRVDGLARRLAGSAVATGQNLQLVAAFLADYAPELRGRVAALLQRAENDQTFSDRILERQRVLAGLESSIETARAEVDGLRRFYREEQERWDQQQRNLQGVYEKLRRDLETKYRQTQDTVVQELDKLDRRRETANREVANLEAETRVQRRAWEDERAKTAHAQDMEKLRLDGELNRMRRQLEDESAQLQSQIADLKIEIKRLNQAIAARETTRAELDNAVARLQAQLQELNQIIATRKTTRAELDDAVATLEAQMQEMDQSIATRTPIRAELDSAVAGLQAQLQELNQAIAARVTTRSELDNAMAPQVSDDSIGAFVPADLARALGALTPSTGMRTRELEQIMLRLTKQVEDQFDELFGTWDERLRRYTIPLQKQMSIIEKMQGLGLFLGQLIQRSAMLGLDTSQLSYQIRLYAWIQQYLTGHAARLEQAATLPNNATSLSDGGPKSRYG